MFILMTFATMLLEAQSHIIGTIFGQRILLDTGGPELVDEPGNELRVIIQELERIMYMWQQYDNAMLFNDPLKNYLTLSNEKSDNDRFEELGVEEQDHIEEANLTDEESKDDL